MTMTGEITSKTAGDNGGTVEVTIRGYNRMGNHLTGSISLDLPA
jgi:hypothetical protein